MKLKSITQVIEECTSVGTSLKGQILLAKNRDRTYIPKISVVHEIALGTEMAYMLDAETDYSEGINEHGIAIVNTTMSKHDATANSSTGKTNKTIQDGQKIRKALAYNSIEQVIESLSEKYKGGLSGHTTIAYKKGFVTIEKLDNGKYDIQHIPKDQTVIRTNHGLEYPNHGDQVGTDRESSISRYHYANLEVKKASDPNELLERLRTHHGQAGYLEPFRTNYKYWTTSQILLNISKLQLDIVLEEGTEFIGITDKLPNQYKPKITINVYQLSTQYKAHKLK